MPRPRQPETIEELLDRVVVCPSGCWLWTGGNSGEDRDQRGSGYGRILRPGTRNAMAAHRYVYEKFIGPIPYGYQVDHLCARWSLDAWISRRCVNPNRLEVITHEENQRRKHRNAAMTREMPLRCEPIDDDFAPADRAAAPLLAPGETMEDFAL